MPIDTMKFDSTASINNMWSSITNILKQIMIILITTNHSGDRATSYALYLEHTKYIR